MPSIGTMQSGQVESSWFGKKPDSEGGVFNNKRRSRPMPLASFGTFCLDRKKLTICRYSYQATHRGSWEADTCRVPLKAAQELARRRRRWRSQLVPPGVDRGQLHAHRRIQTALQTNKTVPSGESLIRHNKYRISSTPKIGHYSEINQFPSIEVTRFAVLFLRLWKSFPEMMHIR